MLGTTDLRGVTIAATDAADAAEAFRAAFGFDVRVAGGSRFARIGGAELEFRGAGEPGSPLAEALRGRGPGLFALVLEVADLDAAIDELARRGHSPVRERTTDGRPAASLAAGPATHGVPIVLVARAG